MTKFATLTLAAALTAGLAAGSAAAAAAADTGASDFLSISSASQTIGAGAGAGAAGATEVKFRGHRGFRRGFGRRGFRGHGFKRGFGKKKFFGGGHKSRIHHGAKGKFIYNPFFGFSKKVIIKK